MDSETLAAIAGSMSAIAAFAALCFSANQNSQNSAAISFASAQKFSDDCRDLWRRSRECVADPDLFDECVGEILGSFELFCIAVNDTSLNRRVLEYILETICDYLNDMVEAGYADYVKPRTIRPHVCKELKQLVIQNQHRFRDRRAVAEMLNIPQSSIA